jgi:hypothetical protein
MGHGAVRYLCAERRLRKTLGGPRSLVGVSRGRDSNRLTERTNDASWVNIGVLLERQLTRPKGLPIFY